MWLAALAACLGANPALAQTVVARPSADSAARGDTLRAGATDSARISGAAGAGDTVGSGGAASTRGSGALGDTIRAADTVPGATADTGGLPDTLRTDTLPPDNAAVPAARAAPAAPPAPVDSVLAAACKATGGDPPDLLTVRFRTTATGGERAEAAKAVGGTLLGRSEHLEPGAWFLQVPNSAIDPTIADRVIRLPPVLQVGATRCPS